MSSSTASNWRSPFGQWKQSKCLETESIQQSLRLKQLQIALVKGRPVGEDEEDGEDLQQDAKQGQRGPQVKGVLLIGIRVGLVVEHGDKVGHQCKYPQEDARVGGPGQLLGQP